jgi:hypothetical protein
MVVSIKDDINASMGKYFGGSIFMTGLIFFAFFIIISYLWTLNHFAHIRKNINKYKCSPEVMPFFGWIVDPPNTEMSRFEYTKQNFSQCLNGITDTIAEDALEPIHYSTQLTLDGYKELTGGLNDARKMFSSVRDKASNVTQEMHNKTLNTMLPLQKMMVSLRNMLGQSQGVVTTGLYSVLGSFLTLLSLKGAILELGGIAVAIAIALGAAIGWFFPPAAIIAAILVALLGSVEIGFDLAFNQSGGREPANGTTSMKRKHCFAPDTIIDIHPSTGQVYTAEEIEVGHNLGKGCGGIITAKMKVSGEHEELYRVGKSIISGTHTIFDEAKERWVPVKEHSDSIALLTRKPTLYCFNTSEKIFTIDHYKFKDWDDMSQEEYEHLTNKFNKPINADNIHRELDGGWDPSTRFSVYDNLTQRFTSKPIHKIKLGDLLEGGEKIIGLVKVKATDLDQGLYPDFFSSKNLQTTRGNMRDVSVSLRKPCFSNILFHLLTDTGKIQQFNRTFLDYNGCIDNFL